MLLRAKRKVCLVDRHPQWICFYGDGAVEYVSVLEKQQFSLEFRKGMASVLQPESRQHLALELMNSWIVYFWKTVVRELAMARLWEFGVGIWTLIWNTICISSLYHYLGDSLVNFLVLLHRTLHVEFVLSVPTRDHFHSSVLIWIHQSIWAAREYTDLSQQCLCHKFTKVTRFWN